MVQIPLLVFSGNPGSQNTAEYEKWYPSDEPRCILCDLLISVFSLYSCCSTINSWTAASKDYLHQDYVLYS